MINKKIKFNKRGFTLIETMVAVFILAISIVSLMSVTSSSLFAAKYARDEITANYLLQEVIDYIRNDRDTTFLSTSNPTSGWSILINKYNSCVAPNGCYFDVIDSSLPQACINSGCPLYFNANPSSTEAYYTNKNLSGTLPKSKFTRKIVVIQNPSNSDEIDVTVTVSWKNGGLTKTRELKTSLLNWQNE